MNLADHPNEAVATANDEEAKAFLSQLGVLEKLEQAAVGPSPFTCQFRLDVWDHPTHWITAIRYIGFHRPEDNGFVVRCQPKSVVTRKAFEQQLQSEKQQEFPEGVTEQRDDLPPIGSN